MPASIPKRQASMRPAGIIHQLAAVTISAIAALATNPGAFAPTACATPEQMPTTAQDASMSPRETITFAHQMRAGSIGRPSTERKRWRASRFATLATMSADATGRPSVYQ